MRRFTLQLVKRELPDPIEPPPTGHLLLKSKMDQFEKGFTLSPEAGDLIVERLKPKLPMPVTKDMPVPSGVYVQPQVVGKLVSVHKHDVGPAGDWELYGVIEWKEGYNHEVDGVPFVSLMLDAPPEGGPRVMDIATTRAPIIEGMKEIKL